MEFKLLDSNQPFYFFNDKIVLTTKEISEKFGKPSIKNDDEITWNLEVKYRGVEFIFSLYILLNGLNRGLTLQDTQTRVFNIATQRNLHSIKEHISELFPNNNTLRYKNNKHYVYKYILKNQKRPELEYIYIGISQSKYRYRQHTSGFSNSSVKEKLKDNFKIKKYEILYIDIFKSGLMDWELADELETRLIHKYIKRDNTVVLNKRKLKKDFNNEIIIDFII